MVGCGELAFRAGDDDGGCSVGEEAAGDEVGDGLVVVLPGEGAEFDREEQGDLFGEGADVVGGAGDAGGSGDAAQAEDGRALDVDGEWQAVDEAGVDGGAGDAGDGGEEDGGDVRGGDSGAREGAGDGGFAEFDGGGDPGGVGLAEADQGGVGVQGQDEVAEFDAAVGVEAGDQARLFELVLPALGEGLGDFGLGVAIGGIGRSDGRDAHSRGESLIAGFVNDRYGVAVERETDRQTMISVSDGMRFPFFVTIMSLSCVKGWLLFYWAGKRRRMLRIPAKLGKYLRTLAVL